MLLGSAGILFLRRLHALLGNLQVHASAIRQLFARAFQNLFQLLLGFGEFLLMKERESFVVDFQLRLDARVNQLDASPLRGRSRG